MSTSNKHEAPIDAWKPSQREILCEKDNKLFRCHFDEIFRPIEGDSSEKLAAYNVFMIGKDSYINHMDVIAHDINYFEAKYDTDKEVMSAYLSIKFAIDKNRLYDENNMKSYIEFLYDILLTDNIIEKIKQMVEDNYLDDIEVDAENKRKYVKSEKKHLESLEFKNQHLKILYCINMGIKLLIPPMQHYFQLNNIKIPKESTTIYSFYSGLFEIFTDSDTYELVDENTGELVNYEITQKEFDEILATDKSIYAEKNGRKIFYKFYDRETCHDMHYVRSEVNMFNKLYVYVKSKVIESNGLNSRMFAQREIMGKDLYWVISFFVKKVIISDILVKYRFPSKWDAKNNKFKENLIGFNKVILRQQLNYFLKEQFSKTITEVTNQATSEGLSGADKLLMNQSKIDEGIVLLADINVKTTINMLKKDNDIEITEDEIDYYIKNFKISDIQKLLIDTYYAKYFNRMTDLSLIPRRAYYYLVILLKKKLLIESGYSVDEDGKIHCAALPYILTGNVSEKVSTRLIRNNKFISKLEQNDIYQDLIKNEYSNLHEIRPDFILSKISSIINTRFEYVTYENPELTGTEINFSEEKVTDEILYFLYRCS